LSMCRYWKQKKTPPSPQRGSVGVSIPHERGVSNILCRCLENKQRHPQLGFGVCISLCESSLVCGYCIVPARGRGFTLQ
jgi:hypothetical protein